ncbi:MAG TPA: DUF1015 domain-containing protein [Actinomycetota bacterium]|nr:DUF1015 domain-containing protein [Actinomycetota bacterium]
MPSLKPFKGIRYSAADNLKNLSCPPYDVISPDEQDRLYARDPHNAVRLELARDGTDSDGYAGVGETFRRWLEDGVLQMESTDALYVYRQDFTASDGSRRKVAGVLGALELEAFGARSGVLPHEKTMPGPKRDRLALMRAVKVNISPIYAIYRGGGGLAPFLDSLEQRPSTVRFADEAGTLNRLWVIDAPAEIDLLTEAVRPGPLVIADGHHRYETALAFHEENTGTPGDHGTIMCFCVDADSEGLVVLPYHRALRTPSGGGAVAAALMERFRARPMSRADAALDTSSAAHPMVFVTQDADLLVEVSDDDVVEVTGPRHPAWRALDVVALHQVVLPAVLDGEEPELAFSKDADEIRRLVGQGWSAGVLLRALSAAAIVDVAGSGERMPQKASYFWPKAVTGLVFHPLT